MGSVERINCFHIHSYTFVHIYTISLGSCKGGRKKKIGRGLRPRAAGGRLAGARLAGLHVRWPGNPILPTQRYPAIMPARIFQFFLHNVIRPEILENC